MSDAALDAVWEKRGPAPRGADDADGVASANSLRFANRSSRLALSSNKPKRSVAPWQGT